MDSNTYRVLRGLSLKDYGTCGWRSFLISFRVAGIFLLLLLAGGGNGNFFPAPLPAVVVKTTTLAHAFFLSCFPQVRGNSLKGVIHLVFRKPGFHIPIPGVLALPLLRFLCRWGGIFPLRTGILFRSPLALVAFLLARVLAALRISSELFLPEKSLVAQSNLLNGHNQSVVLFRDASSHLGQVLPQLGRQAVLQDLPPGDAGDSDRSIPGLEVIDVLENVPRVLDLEELVVICVLLVIGLEPFVHGREKRAQGIGLSVVAEVAGTFVVPGAGLTLQECADDSNESFVVIPGALVVLEVVVHVLKPVLVGRFS